MKALLAILTVSALLAGTARAKEVEDLMHRAEACFHEQRFEEAVEAYEAVIHEGGLENDFAPKAFERIALCLVHLGKREEAVKVLERAIGEYEGRPDIQGQLKKTLAQVKTQGDGARPHDATRPDDRAVLRRHVRPEELEALEQRRREAEKRLQGLDQARREMERQRAELERKLEELRRMFEEHGLPPERIEERVDQVRERHARELAARREIEDTERRLREEGVPPEVAKREIEELRRRLHEEMEADWREGHRDDLREARREFIHLAERLGIPAEQAERFLEEHTRRRPDKPFERGEQPDRCPDDVMRRIEELERKLGHALERLERGLRTMDERLRKLEKTR